MIDGELAQEHYDLGFGHGHDQGFRFGKAEGYRSGEFERIALATANSDLRSELLAANQRIESLEGQMAEFGWGNGT